MDLVDRGLNGVRHVTSDAHPGLKKAIASVLPGSTWNRCYTHFSRNVLSKLPRKAQGKAIALLRSVTAENDSETAWDQYNKVADRLSTEHPQLTDMLITPVRRYLLTRSILWYSGARFEPTTRWKTLILR